MTAKRSPEAEMERACRALDSAISMLRDAYGAHVDVAPFGAAHRLGLVKAQINDVRRRVALGSGVNHYDALPPKGIKECPCGGPVDHDGGCL